MTSRPDDSATNPDDGSATNPGGNSDSGNTANNATTDARTNAPAGTSGTGGELTQDPSNAQSVMREGSDEWSDVSVPQALMDAPNLPRTVTGVRGLDHILNGGLPNRRVTVISGTSGAGKTLLSCEVAYRTIHERGRNVVLVTCEETGEDICRNVETLGWPFTQYIDDGRLTLVDATPQMDYSHEAGEYDLSGLVIQIESAIRETGAGLVVVDSLVGLFQQFSNEDVVRRELYRICRRLKEMDVITILSAERLNDSSTISRFAVEDFLADVVLVLRQTITEERVRRTIQIHKLRGDAHAQGEFPFTITSNGIYILPLSEVQLSHESDVDRLKFGNDTFDQMTGSGLFRDSIVLVSGPTGSGKTLLSTSFAAGGCEEGERVLYLGFEESNSQLERNAVSWGKDFPGWRKHGRLRVISRYPESAGLQGHLVAIREEIDRFKPRRFILDSVSALERIANVRMFREFVIALTGYLKEKQVCTLLTSTSSNLSGGDSVTEQHISTITDSIVLLRYVESQGELRRGLIVIKMRGSQHEKLIREFTISDRGMTIGEPFENLRGNVLLGN